jgi:high-affinity nickel-transport protein
MPYNRISSLRHRIVAIGLLLVIANIVAWIWAIVALRHHAVLMGTALLAYSFGLRHAVDADHIAAIDNVTRKLMQEGKRPVTVGLFFSLGHSTVVVLLCLAVALTTVALQDRFDAMKSVGGLISTSISAFFLFAIAAGNIGILRATWRGFLDLRAGRKLPEDGQELSLAGGGVMARLFRRLFRMVGRGWHMYLLGLLFGLGFETATEVGLLGVSAQGAAEGLSPWVIMVLPALFSAGMVLVDTLDGALMLGAYGWAFVKPVRKLYYNLTITALSVLVAIIVGGIEILGLVEDRMHPDGSFWSAIAAINENFGLLGYGIIGLFVAGWAASLAIYRIKGFDRIEADA